MVLVAEVGEEYFFFLYGGKEVEVGWESDITVGSQELACL
jgi:hypothetical protein